MELELQVVLRENEKYFNYLKQNSYYIKYLNRGDIDYKTFINDMKTRYKERTTDKISKVIDNIDLINTVLDTLN